jgi:hypothetical protein
MSIPRRCSGVAVLLLAAAGACAPRTDAREALLNPRARPRAECRVSAAPADLPSVGQVVDSAALFPAVADAWRAAGSPRGFVLLSLRFDTAGMNVRRVVLESEGGSALADSVQKLVFAHPRRAASSPTEWGVRLRIDLGDVPTARVGRWEVCRPVPRDPRLERMAGGWDVRSDIPFVSPNSLIWVRVLVDANGMVRNARIERSLIPPRATEQRLLNYALSIPFIPATEDGYPVELETSIAVPIA